MTGILVLLDYTCGEKKDNWSELIRPATFLPADMPIDAALLRLRSESQLMGIVIDDSGRAVGIATMKDLVEEIVGELSAW